MLRYIRLNVYQIKESDGESMKKNPLMQAAELADLLNGIKDILQAVQSQLLEQDLRIIKLEEQLGISGADLASDQEEN